MQMLAQPREPDADGGLALTELLGHARDAARVVEQVEQLQQLEVGEFGRGRHDAPLLREAMTTL
ncbi:hypothetical protein PT2222_70301 [Paraburkholderia tropica]